MQKFIEIEKIYLDSNIVVRYFKNFVINRKIPFILKILSSTPNFKLVTSSWAFAEVFEVMRKEFNLNSKQISKIYKNFIKDFRVEIIAEFNFNSEIIKLVRSKGLEAKDALHLLISKTYKLSLLTTDKKLIERGMLDYSKVLTPEEIILEFSDFLKLRI